ncbi:MAG TPA: UDP-N-acetylmuramoyl-L-alanine--D-glutamate ligase [Mariprofundaceae bacterium]|nr:UDP-N-acetylmuramoyl-L-alanine--D-glutamate ligase [Mariprofundaceae bacterium]
MKLDTAVVGMGRTGCSVARFLMRQDISCEGFDEQAVNLPEDIDMPLHVGKLESAGLAEYARIVVSPGVPWQHPALRQARQTGVPVVGDLDLFIEAFRGELLAVTGTNGKTTTVSLIGTMLETLPGGVETGGNIGTPMLDLLDGLHKPERAALELSSFQLERCRQRFHPHWAALLNVQPDHVDMHVDPTQYEAAKLRIFEDQGEGDTAVLPVESRWDETAGTLQKRGVRVRRFGTVEEADAGLLHQDGASYLFWHQGERRHSVDVGELLVCGAHQFLNLAVAAQAAADFGVSVGVIHEALTSFRGLPHRLQLVGQKAGHRWFDDSKATNPSSAAAALAAFDRALWICGGLPKGVDLAPLVEVVRRHVAHAFVIGKDPKPYVDLLKRAGVPYSVVGNITRAVVAAASHTEAEPVLLAPAAASQDQFRDYAERGGRFIDAVASLEKAA